MTIGKLKKIIDNPEFIKIFTGTIFNFNFSFTESYYHNVD